MARCIYCSGTGYRQSTKRRWITSDRYVYDQEVCDYCEGTGFEKEPLQSFGTGNEGKQGYLVLWSTLALAAGAVACCYSLI
jgi:hypothetical protein